MNKSTMLLVLAFCGAVFCAEWKTKNVKDEATGKVSTAAYITSAEGHSFTITKQTNGTIWGSVQLAGDNQFGEQGDIMVQFDSNTPVEFNDRLTKSSVGIKMWEWYPKVIAFQMWHGKIGKGCGLMGLLYNAKTIYVRYHLNESTTKDISFVISGNQSVICSAIGVDISTCSQSISPKPASATGTPATGTVSTPVYVNENGQAPSTIKDAVVSVNNTGTGDWINCTANAKGYFYSVWGDDKGNVLVAGSQGLIRSNFLITNWQVVISEIVTFVQGTSSGDIYAGGTNLYHSTDGIKWDKQLSMDGYIEGIVTVSAGKVVVVTQYGSIYKTNNNGQSWSRNHLPVLNGNPAVKVVLALKGILLAGCEKGVLLRSVDEGETWTQVVFPSTKCIVGLWSPSGNPGIIYSAFNTSEEKGALAQSKDGGSTWTQCYTFPTSSTYSNGGIWGTDSNDFYVMFMGALYHTRNAGVTWESNEGFYNLCINAAGRQVYWLGLDNIHRLR